MDIKIQKKIKKFKTDKVQNVSVILWIITNVSGIALLQCENRWMFGSRDCIFETNVRKPSARKLDARAVYMKWKELFRPSGCIVPSLKMISISNCFRLTLTPTHFRKPLTAISDMLCPGELKCSATGKPVVFFWTLRRCSPKRSRRVRPVSPM